MARTITEIQQSIIDEKNAYPALAALNSPSKVAIWLLWTYVVAVCFWTLEKLFDLHLEEVNGIIAATKPHKVKWYVTMSKGFMLGYDLVEDQDYYDTEGLTEEQIEDAQVVKFAACKEVNKGLRIKVATLFNSDLAAIDNLSLDAYKAYMARVKDAGVHLDISSSAADSLKLNLIIYYNALVLDSTGARLDGSAVTPVADAVNAFLKTQSVINFDGLFVVAHLQDALQAVEGVEIPHIALAQARFGTKPYADVLVEYPPDAGYLRIINPADLQITYIAHEPV
jgi:hypothetical protein